MTHTIAQLWNGNLEPVNYLGRNNPEMKKLESLIQRNFEKLEVNLDEKEKKVFERFNESMNEYVLVCSEQAFCDGFCLGAKIVAEALNGAEQVI